MIESTENTQIVYPLRNPDGGHVTFEMHEGFFTPLWESSHNFLFIVFLYSLTWNSLYRGQDASPLFRKKVPFLVEEVAQHILRRELEEYFNECLEAENDCIVENNDILKSKQDSERDDLD